MTLPQHPGSNDDSSSHERPPRSKATYLSITIGMLLVVAFIALHLTGVIGPESHG